jgi:hypothetical protein
MDGEGLNGSRDADVVMVREADIAIECFLCDGRGKLSRSELLRRLGADKIAEITRIGVEQFVDRLNIDGMKVFHEAISQIRADAEERRRIEGEQNARREKELLADLEASKARMINGVKEAELRSREDSLETIRALDGQISDLRARLSLSDKEREGQVEAAKLEERKRAFDLGERARRFEEQVAEQARDLAATREELARLETRLSRVSATKGQAAEIAFNEHLGSFEHLRCSDKLPRHGDYEVSVKVARFSGEIVPIQEPILADVKDVAVSNARMRKLVEDARERKRRVAAIVVSTEEMLRAEDKRHPFTVHEGVFVLTTTRDSFPRDAFLLAPLLEQLASVTIAGGDAESRLAQVVNEIGGRLALLGKIATSVSKARRNLDGISKEIDQIEVLTQQFTSEIRALLTGSIDGDRLAEVANNSAEGSIAAEASA